MTTPGSGSADELNALLTTLTQWAQRAMPAPPSGQVGPECQWCPLCQLASALRGEHPELTERLAEAGAAVSGAARALLESASRVTSASTTGSDGADEPAAAPAGPADATRTNPPARSRPRPRVERIELDGVPGPS